GTRAEPKAFSRCPSLAWGGQVSETRVLRRGRGARVRSLVFAAAVVTAREVMLEEDVEDDEHVARAHLLQGQLRLPGGAVLPGGRHDGVREPAHDRLQ